ncbi:MAG TPA: hypothetical protein VFQ76_04090 [Longimicrobiaceae bacterium]|nr:hypothetical protein [Longimicrobiaceae bacterium]
MSKNDDDAHTPPPGGAKAAAPQQEDGFAEFLKAFAPALQSGLDARASADPRLGEVAGGMPPTDDVALATQLSERLFTEEMARRFFPRDAAELLGRGEWRWCLPLVRCCWMFGWLVCRGCRDYQALNYYLYRYWLCVRTAAGRNPREQVSAREREEFRALAALLGQTYSAWLKEEEMKVALDAGAVDDVLDGRTDCCRDNAFTTALFDRLATQEAAVALLGREAFAEHAKNPWFWLCRCWCRAAIRFGCCLACARSQEELRRCLAEYERSLAECVGPLRCELTRPSGCFEEQPILEIQDLGVPVTGTAMGAFFAGYTIEWRIVEGEDCASPLGWTSVGVVYPGSGPMGSAPVLSGTLGWIKTRLLPARSYEVRICVKTSRPGAAPPCCCIIFNLFKRFVWINRVGAAWVGDSGVFDPDAPLVHPPLPDPSSHLVPVGCCVNVHGAAWVGECNDRRIRCFSLHYAPGFLPGPTQPGFNPALYTPLPGQPPVCYTPPDEAEKRAQPNELTANDSILTTHWQQVTIDISSWFGLPPHTIEHTEWHLQPQCFDSRLLPACLDAAHSCGSGQYTLLLDVEDTLGNHYYDTQHAWFDNKQLHVSLAGIEGLKQCQTMSMRRFTGSRPCDTPWPIPVMGTAYDEYIVPSDLSYPSNNFDFYTLTITRNCGGPTYQVPITRDLVNFDKDILTGAIDPLKGTAHVGTPAPVCACDPPLGPAQHGVLTLLDMRAFDAACSPLLPAPFRPPPGFALQRGECCAYSIQLYAQDKTVDGTGPGICHRAWTPCCAITVCNDLPREEIAVARGANDVDDLLARDIRAAEPGSGAAAEAAG